MSPLVDLSFTYRGLLLELSASATLASLLALGTHLTLFLCARVADGLPRPPGFHSTWTGSLNSGPHACI